MPVYVPPQTPLIVRNAVNGDPSPRPSVYLLSDTPPLSEMVKGGMRCESDLVIEPARGQASQTGQQFSTTQRIATVDGSREISGILVDTGRGGRSLSVVVTSGADVALASTLTQQARSETAGPVTGTIETAAVVPQKDPSPAQYEESFQPVPFYYQGVNTALGAAEYTSLNTQSGGQVVGYNPNAPETTQSIPSFTPGWTQDTAQQLGGFDAGDWQAPGSNTLGLTYEELFYLGLIY